MEWEIVVDHKNNYVEIVTRGIADNTGALRMAKELAETMKRNRIRRGLIDHRNVQGVSGSVNDIYERPKLFAIIGMILGIRIAEVIQPCHIEHFKFLETVCVNRGFSFSVFYDKADAVKWLSE